MPNLKKLVLKNTFGGNPLTEEYIEVLRRAMPWCKIVWEE